MLPKWHILFGLIFCILLWLFQVPLYALAIIWIASVGIDVDHYIIYIISKKDWSLPRAYKFFKEFKKPGKYHLCFFHTIEFLAVLALLAFLHKLFYFILIGILFHLAVDFSAMVIKKYKNRILFFSAIARFVQYKRKS